MQSLSPSDLDTIKKWLGTGSINIFGRQFAGKDTQCRELAKLFDGVVIGGGDILRNGNTPQHVLDEINRGNLSPTEEYIAIVTPYLSRQEFANRPLILSSVGRMKGEENAIITAANQSNHEIKAVVFLDIDEQTAWQRFETAKQSQTREQRSDDASSKLEKRLRLYDEQTIPVIEHYRQLGLVIDVDGSFPVSEVSERILSALLDFSRRTI